MTNLNFTDLEILHLGIKNNGRFNENDIAQSEIKNIGVGRILDQLASLKERKLIQMNHDGSFSITDMAKHVLWDDKIPLWIKILRVLEIKSNSIERISAYLLTSSEKINEEIEDLRKKQLVLMSPLRIEERVVKMYEILPEGLEQIKKAQSEGLDLKLNIKNQSPEIFELIDQVINEVKTIEDLSEIKKGIIISLILQIKTKLKN